MDGKPTSCLNGPLKWSAVSEDATSVLCSSINRFDTDNNECSGEHFKLEHSQTIPEVQSGASLL
jgi:hypothetical protein